MDFFTLYMRIIIIIFLLMIMHASLYVYQNNVFLFLMRLKFSSLFLRSFNFDKYI